MSEAAKILVCSVCQKPRIIEWSRKWTPAERLFLIAMLGRIQREESMFGKKRGSEWEDASPDPEWLIHFAYARADAINTFIADLIVKTVLEFCPDTKLDAWLKDIQERIYQ